MGLFSSKKKIYVSSVVYNMAGPIVDRTSFLKTTVMRQVLSPSSKRGFGMSLVDNQIAGPAFAQRRFFQWAKTNYPEGALSGYISNKASVNSDAVRPYIAVPAGRQINIQGAHIDSGDYSYWVEQFLMMHRPTRFAEEWVSDIDTTTNEVTIEYPDGTSEGLVLSGYNPSADHVFAYYSITDPVEPAVTVRGALLQRQIDAPDLTGFTLTGSKVYSEQLTLPNYVTTKTVIDGGTPVVTKTVSPQIVTFEGTEQTWGMSTRYSPDPTKIQVLEDRTTLWVRTRPVLAANITSQVDEIVPGTVVTTTTTTFSIDTRWDHRTDTVTGDVVVSNIEEPRIFIYQIGTGNRVLDSLQTSRWAEPEFYPIIPLRINNASVRAPQYQERFKVYEKAYRKAVGEDINSLIDTVEDNEQLGDIDYAYMVHGVELNTKDREGKRFIYEFLKTLILQQGNAAAQFESWRTGAKLEQDAFLEQFSLWEQSQLIPDESYASTRPTILSRVVPPVSTIDIRTPGGSGLDFWFKLSWTAIMENVGAGQGRPGAVTNDLWWEVVGAGTSVAGIPVYALAQGLLSLGSKNFEHIRLYWQTSATTFKYLDIYGLTHENFIYGNKSVEISAAEALADVDETGFIIPLHDPSVRKLGIVAANELNMNTRLVVFNSYLVKKTKWYQTFVFKIIFAAILSVIFLPAGAGLLGGNLAVGAAMGLSGTAALFAGAVANALAAVVLTTVIQAGATEVFGDKLGAIIAAVATAFAFAYVGNFQMTGSWNFNWAEMMRVDNLLNLTDSVAGGIQNWARAEMGDISEQAEAAFGAYKDSMSEIERMAQENLGYSGVFMDPLMLTSAQGNSFSSESSTAFLTRTLMTGSEIADLSFSMIESFAELSLKLPKIND